MSKKVVYVAGPISKGNLVANVFRAHDAGMTLIKAGLSPIVPHGNCFWGNRKVEGEGIFAPVVGFIPEVLPAGTVIEDWYLADLAIVGRCGAVLRLPGESVGADLEVREAEAKGIPVFHEIGDVIRWDEEGSRLSPAESSAPKPPAIDTEWRHKGTGKVYVVTDHVKAEDPDDGEWMDAVGYHSTDALVTTLFVRTVERFLERFDPVKP